MLIFLSKFSCSLYNIYNYDAILSLLFHKNNLSNCGLRIHNNLHGYDFLMNCLTI